MAWNRPLVTERTTDFLVHDLAIDSCQVLRGTFQPMGPDVTVEIEAAFSMWGTARGALLLYIGQPDDPGSVLHDAGGKPLPGVQLHSVASVNGESAWATTTSRRLHLEFDPSKPVTWQLLGAIIGAAWTVPVEGCESIAITPDGTRAYVTSPAQGTVTPVRLGRPGYSYRRDLDPQDEPEYAIAVGGRPSAVAASDEVAVVADAAAARVVVIAGSEARSVDLGTSGSAAGVALAPNGDAAVVTTAAGEVALVDLRDDSVARAEVASSLRGVSVTADGSYAYAADPGTGTLYRLALPSLDVKDTIELGELGELGGRPWVIRTAPDDRGLVWVLGRPAAPAKGWLVSVDPATNEVEDRIELPFDSPNDFALGPVAGQTCDVVHTAWVVYDERYSQMNVAGRFKGQVHTWHNGAFVDFAEGLTGVAMNDFGEIWVVRSKSDLVWKWPGGRMLMRSGHEPGVFFGEYCTVAVYGAAATSSG